MEKEPALKSLASQSWEQHAKMSKLSQCEASCSMRQQLYASSDELTLKAIQP